MIATANQLSAKFGLTLFMHAINWPSVISCQSQLAITEWKTIGK